MKFAIFTATATTFTRQVIFASLMLDHTELFVLELDPNRSNITYTTHPISPENYLQESGQIRRDGEQSYSLILFNGLLSGRASSAMKDYIHSQSCRRVQLMKHLPSSICSTGVSITGCHCCDNCANSCDCGSCDNWSLIIKCDANRAQKVRKVSLGEKEKIKEMLEPYSASLNSRDRPRMVSVPNILLEHGHFHIDQVLKSCHKIFKKSDLYDCVKICRTVHANNILVVLDEVFGDIEEDISDLDLVGLSEDVENAVCPEWQCIRDDTALVNLGDSDLEVYLDSIIDKMDISAEEDSFNM
eukprot:gene13657-15086_t